MRVGEEEEKGVRMGRRGWRVRMGRRGPEGKGGRGSRKKKRTREKREEGEDREDEEEGGGLFQLENLASSPKAQLYTDAPFGSPKDLLHASTPAGGLLAHLWN